MKILHIMASCSIESGVAQVAMSYYRNISDDVTFDFLLYWDVPNSFKEEIERLGGTVYVTGKPGVKSAVSYLRQLDCFFSEHEGEYDAVHLHEVYLGSIIFPIAKRHGIRVRIAHSHTTKLSERKFGEIRNKVLYFPVKWVATHFFGCSKAAGEAAFGAGITGGPDFYLMKNAIDTERFEFSDAGRAHVRTEFGLGDCPVIGHVGRFCTQKNQQFLLEIFAEIRKKKPDAKLMLVGNGPQFADVGARAAELGLADHVMCPGARKDIGACLSAMDVFVLPSIFEGLGIVLVEAQCNRLPCVASTQVPMEAKILSGYQSISLEEAPSVWADAIISCCGAREERAVCKVADAGYKIQNASHMLLDKYKQLCNESTRRI